MKKNNNNNNMTFTHCWLAPFISLSFLLPANELLISSFRLLPWLSYTALHVPSSPVFSALLHSSHRSVNDVSSASVHTSKRRSQQWRPWLLACDSGHSSFQHTLQPDSLPMHWMPYQFQATQFYFQTHYSCPPSTTYAHTLLLHRSTEN